MVAFPPNICKTHGGLIKEGEEKGRENEDPSTQKKPRVVWSPELHKKFVAAVHQLGVDKAFPKKILDLMNVEGLTRENVASHLQKFRGYLKKASMVPAIGGKDTSYMRTGALEGFGDLHSLAGSVRLANTALSSTLTHGRMLRRLNSPAGLTLTGSTSTGLIQLSNPQNLSNSVNNLVKFRSSLPANQNANLFQGIPVSLDANQLQQTKCPNHLVDISALNNPTGLTVSSGLQDARAAVGSSSTAPNYSSNTLMLPGIAQQIHSGGAL